MASWRLAALASVLALGGCASRGESVVAYGPPTYDRPVSQRYPEPAGTLNWTGKAPGYGDGPVYAQAPASAPPPAYGPQPAYRPQPVSNPQPAYAGGRYANWGPEDYLYRVEPGDELSLRFVSNPDMNGQVIIGPDGRGVFPLVSGVRVADLTAEQVNGVLTQAYGQILRHPEVEVLVANYGAAQVYVAGEVKEPGVKPIKGRLTIVQALASAGGLAPTAHTNEIVVIRSRPGGRMLVRVVNLKSMTNVDADFAILPGDMIFVPRSKAAEVDLFVDQYIKGALPFTTSIGYNINPVPY